VGIIRNRKGLIDMTHETQNKRGGPRPGAGRKPGPPPDVIQIKAPEGTKARWRKEAEAAGKTLSEWIRDQCERRKRRSRR
jgi:hypothetical protein